MMKRSPCFTVKLTRDAAVNDCFPVRYSSVMPSTVSRLVAARVPPSASSPSTPGRILDFREKEIFPRGETLLNRADAAHEFGVLHHIFGGGRKLHGGIAHKRDDFLSRKTALGSR